MGMGNYTPQLKRRMVRLRSETVGPKHDPYGRDILTVEQELVDGTNLDVVFYRCGLAGFAIKVNDNPRTNWSEDGEEAAELFEDLVGCSPHVVEMAYYRLRAKEEPAPVWRAVATTVREAAVSRERNYAQPHEVVQEPSSFIDADYRRARVTAFLSVYEVHRCYGGPEEGGWWYDAFEFTGVSIPFFADQEYEREEAEDPSESRWVPVGLPIVTDEHTRVMLQSVRTHLAYIYGDPNAKQERFSVNGGADVAFYYELQPGSRETTERPRYE